MRCAACPMAQSPSMDRPIAELLAELADCDACPLTEGHACDAAQGAQLVRALRDAAHLYQKEQRALKKANNVIRELRDAARQATDRVEKLEAMQKESLRQADSELRAKMDLVARQQAAILALSTPTIEVMDGVLALPIIGALDDERANMLTQNLLDEILRVRARYAILDLTGVSSLDGRSARLLSHVASAVRLLGAQALLCGIRPQVAQELVNSREDLRTILTSRTLKEALRHCAVAES